MTLNLNGVWIEEAKLRDTHVIIGDDCETFVVIANPTPNQALVPVYVELGEKIRYEFFEWVPAESGVVTGVRLPTDTLEPFSNHDVVAGVVES